MEVAVYDITGKETGKMNLPELFETKVSPTLLHEIVIGYLANQRAGTHNTKTRSEVKGGGAKPWRQKGTGRARSGTARSPLWRKGGVIFGPKPRDYNQDIPRKKRQKALKMALSNKTKDGSLIVVDDVSINELKTKNVVQILKSLKVSNDKVLMITDKTEAKLKIAGRNIQDLCIEEAKHLNTYAVLWADKVVITSGAVNALSGNKSQVQQQNS